MQVELFPSVNCIVHLASKPVFIAELEEIDMVYYERVTPGGGNFDLALIYKKFLNTNPAPKLNECWERVGNIDVKYLDNVREVLQKSTIPQFEGTTTMAWANILRDYIKNFDDISADGGWKVLFGQDSDGEDEVYIPSEQACIVPPTLRPCKSVKKETARAHLFAAAMALRMKCPCSASSCGLMPTSLLQDEDEEDEDEDFGATLGESGSEFESEDESSDDYSEASEDDSDDESEELSSEGKCGKGHERERGRGKIAEFTEIGVCCDV